MGRLREADIDYEVAAEGEDLGRLGLVDPRLRAVSDGKGRADRRVVEALRKVVDEQTGRSTVSAQVRRRRTERLLEAEHGPGVVPLPSRTAFYRLLKTVASGRHTLGPARTRRSPAKQPNGMSGQLTTARPDEVMEIDPTALDVPVVHDDGTVDTVELTGTVDIATPTSENQGHPPTSPLQAAGRPPRTDERPPAAEHSIITAIWHMRTPNVPHRELGGTYFVQHDPERAARRAITALNQLGCTVTLNPIEGAA